LIEIAIVVALDLAAREDRVGIGRPVEALFDREIEPIEALVDTGTAAEIGEDRQPRVVPPEE